MQGYPELSVPAKKGSKAQLVTVRETIVKQGEARAYAAWLREKLHPALVNARASGRDINKVVMGGHINTFYTVRQFESWAELDNTNQLSSLRGEERTKIFEGFTDRIQQASMLLLSYREDLSFEGPKK